MSAGVPLVCSDTGPVREVLTANEDALLVPFEDPELISASLADCLMDKEKANRRARRAMRRASAYDTSEGLQRWKALLGAGG